MVNKKYKTYTIRPCTLIGTYFYCECGNEMYSMGGPLKYNGKLCPKCHSILKIKRGELKKWGYSKNGKFEDD